MNAKASTPAMDVLDLLGNQLVLDPESLAMLKQEGKVTDGEFAALMEVLGEGEVSSEQLLKNLENTGASKLNPELLKSLVPSEGEVKLGAKEILETAPKNLAQKANSEISNPLKEILSKDAPVKLEQAQVAVKAETLESKNPNLVKLSQFMEKQTAATQKRFQQAGSYAAPEKSMFVEKVEATNNMAKNGAATSAKAVTLQDLMFAGSDETNLDSGEQKSTPQLNTIAKANTNNISTDASKVFDMSQLAGDKSLSSEAVITKIQDYILQTRASNEKSVQMSFNHKELGQVGLHVQKHDGASIGITISTASVEGAKFFNQNQGELLQTLSSVGIQVGDFKLETSKAGTNLNQDSNESSKQFAGNNKQGAQSESGERKQEQEKRQTLWEQFSEQQAAA